MSTCVLTHGLTAVVGVSDVIVVTTDDAVLVLGAEYGDRVKQLVEELKRQKRKVTQEHTPRLPPLGLLPVDRQRRPLSGQAHRGEARS